MRKAELRDLMALGAGRAGRLWVGCAVAGLGVICRVAVYLFLFGALSSLLRDGGAGLPIQAGLAGASFLAGHVLTGLAAWICHEAAFDILHDLRLRLLDKLARLPLGYFAIRPNGSLKRLVNEQVEELELFFSHQLPDMVGVVLVVPATLVVVAMADWRLALAAGAILPGLVLINHAMMRGHGPKIARYGELLQQIDAGAVEYLQGIEVIQATNGGDAACRKLQGQIDAFRQFASAWQQSWLLPWTLFAVTAGGALMLVLPLGLWLVATGRCEVAELLLGILAATGLAAPLTKLSLYIEIYLRVIAAGRSVSGLLAAPELAEAAAAEPFPSGHELRFEQVSLAERGRTILDRIDLVLPAGQVSAIIGPSGAGKTSLVRLISRQIEASAGVVRIGGTDVRALALADLATNIALICQDVFLFNDSILENILIGRADATVEDAIAAARRARLHDFVQTLPDGYDSSVGENGGRLSGGQRQRLALARALLRDAPILILDEITADVDPHHERLIQEAVNELGGHKTIVIVSHRLDSVRHCDRLVLLRDGRIDAVGRHHELMAKSAAYRCLCAMQDANLRWRDAAPGPAEPIFAEVG
jgi:ABC-type multidrug transport system fused ATPase/permease subunit